jgi:hypothetical protein
LARCKKALRWDQSREREGTELSSLILFTPICNVFFRYQFLTHIPKINNVFVIVIVVVLSCKSILCYTLSIKHKSTKCFKMGFFESTFPIERSTTLQQKQNLKTSLARI